MRHEFPGLTPDEMKRSNKRAINTPLMCMIQATYLQEQQEVRDQINAIETGHSHLMLSEPNGQEFDLLQDTISVIQTETTYATGGDK